MAVVGEFESDDTEYKARRNRMTQDSRTLLHPTQLWELLTDTFVAWNNDNVPRHGAALAYYSILSLVPLLIILIAMIGIVFGQEVVQSYILEQIGYLVGPQSSEAIKDMLQRAREPSTGVFATVLATGTLVFAASGVFAQLQDSLNSIWGVVPKEGRGLWAMIQDRFMSVATVLGTGFLLLVSLALSATLAAVGKWFAGWLPAPEVVLQVLDVCISFIMITGLFAMIFKVLPDAQVPWKSVWTGAALTALLFTIGKFMIGFYLGKSDVGSAYGTAGSLVIVLIWVYYSSQILLFGAEFTQVYTNRIGARIMPSEHAVVADPQKADDTVVFRPSLRGRDTTKQTDNRIARDVARSSGHPPHSDERLPWWVGVLLIGVSVFRSSRRATKSR